MSDSETQVWEDEEMNTDNTPSLDDELDNMFPTDEMPVESVAAVADEMATLDDELDNMFPTDEEPAYVAEETDVAVEAVAEEPVEEFGAEDVPAEDLPVEDLPVEDAAEEVAYADESVEDALEDYSAFEEAEVAPVEEMAVAEESATAPASTSLSQGADDFNLATLNQLVDEIRQESQRVSDMKASVAKALSLIQEMSESLKS